MSATQRSSGNPVYRSLSMLVSVAGGLLASALFARLWRRVSGEPEIPTPESTEHSTREVLVVAVLQGAVTAGIRAAITRAGAKGIRSMSHPATTDEV